MGYTVENIIDMTPDKRLKLSAFYYSTVEKLNREENNVIGYKI